MNSLTARSSLDCPILLPSVFTQLRAESIMMSHVWDGIYLVSAVQACTTSHTNGDSITLLNKQTNKKFA